MPTTTSIKTSLNHTSLRRTHEGAGFRPLRTLAAGLFLALVPVLSARANTFVVTTTADGNNGACTVSLCTLRDAVIAANANPGSDEITLPAGTYTLSIPGANENAAATGDLDITGGVTGGLVITGAGALTTIVDGGALDRVFDIIGAGTLVTFSDMTIRNGQTTGQGGGINSQSAGLGLQRCIVTSNQAGGQGGGIFASAVTLINTTVSNNRSTGDQGGGLFLINGSSSIQNSTISGNTAAQEGGGFYLNGSTSVSNPALLTIFNSTISNNTVTSSGGGAMFLLSQATVNIVSSTIASNSAPTTGGNILNGASLTLKNTIVSNPITGTNCSGSLITDGGGNLQFPGNTCGATITTGDPLLQALASNGGPTQTRALGGGSPALNAASGCPPPSTDQRGISRPQGSACEIGAFECQSSECGGIAPTNTPTQPGATATPTNTPTNTPTTVAATPTRTPTPITGVVVPTLTPPMLALLGLALAGAALLFLKKH